MQITYFGAVKKCSPQDCAGRSLGARRPATHFSFVCALRRLLPVRLAELHCHDVLCCSPTAAGMRQQSAAVGRRRTARLYESQFSTLFYTLPFVRTKGNTKNRRGETISGSATAPALNRMPSALLKQSKGLRFFTLRRCDRPLSEIASAAGQVDACVLMKCFRVATCCSQADDL